MTFQTLVIDNGSGVCKVGFAGNDSPTSVFPSVIGTPKHKLYNQSNNNNTLVGNEAMRKRGILSLSYPIDHGAVVNWDHMEIIWDHAFNELQVTSNQHPLLLTETQSMLKTSKATTAQILFEQFGVPALCFENSALLSLYDAGKVTGVVVESGDCGTHVVPIHEGKTFAYNTTIINTAGRDLTENLIRLLMQRGYTFTVTSSWRELVKEIKEQLCFVSLNYDEDMKTAKNSCSIEKYYELPDGNLISLAEERFMCPETMFQPMFAEQSNEGIHQAVVKAIDMCDINFRGELYNNIVLSGGNTMLKGFEERLQFELTKKVPEYDITIDAQQERNLSAWRGGSAVAAGYSFISNCVSKAEYAEKGPRAFL